MTITMFEIILLSCWFLLKWTTIIAVPAKGETSKWSICFITSAHRGNRGIESTISNSFLFCDQCCKTHFYVAVIFNWTILKLHLKLLLVAICQLFNDSTRSGQWLWHNWWSGRFFTRDPWFESGHWKLLLTFQWYWKRWK